MENKEIVIFMPSIEKGGVEKNLFIVSNYLSNKFKKVSLVTADKIKTNYSNKSSNIFSQNSIIYSKRNRILKSIIASFYLIKKIFISKKIIILSFQSNIWAIIISILFNVNLFSFSFNDFWYLLFLGIVPTIFGHSVFYYLVKYFSPTVVASIPLGEPFIASLIAYFIFPGQIINIYILLGGIITITGLFIITRSQKK